MAEPLKNLYNRQFFNKFFDAIKLQIVDFDTTAFLNNIFDKSWENRELKQRISHISTVLKQFLPENYESSADILINLSNYLNTNQKYYSFQYLFIPDYIEQFGVDNFEKSMVAIEEITKFTSCEFAVRPFIKKSPKKMMEQMFLWSTNRNENVRRLASEGCRPRLPWAMALNDFKRNPEPIIPILENLRNDNSLFVRKSVANNLNDISKDHSNLVLKLVESWQGESKNVDWVIKHGSRTLFKQGCKEALTLFGVGSVGNLSVIDFEIITPIVKVGDFLEFQFQINNHNSISTKIRVEYLIFYKKANGDSSRKIYKISEKEYSQNSKTLINRKQSFKKITTRKFYAGKHTISIVINGTEMCSDHFYVKLA